jgi:phage antirepressor YoqD-like protein
LWPPSPKTLTEALQLALDQSKQLELQAPKVETFDALINSEKLTCLQDAGKVLGLKPKVFIWWLRDNGYLFYRGNRLIPYQDAVLKKLFVVKMIPKNTQVGFWEQTFVTSTGLDYFRKLRDNGTIPFNVFTEAGY